MGPKQLLKYGKNATDLEQDKRNWNERDSDEAEGRARPPNTKLLVHGSREQREPRAERRAEEIIASEHARRVLRIRI